jgi:hypothetical protein
MVSKQAILAMIFISKVGFIGAGCAITFHLDISKCNKGLLTLFKEFNLVVVTSYTPLNKANFKGALNLPYDKR